MKIARNILTGLLWGHRSDSKARASPRQTLSELRSGVGQVSSDLGHSTQRDNHQDPGIGMD